MAFDAKRQRFKALDEEPGVEGADAGAEVAEGFGADAGDETSAGNVFGEVDAVVGRIGRSEVLEAARCSPVEFAVFNDEAA